MTPPRRSRLFPAVFAALAAAPAAAGDGLYGGVAGGANQARDQSVGTSTARFAAGGVGALTLGYATRSGLRPELEAGYRRNGAETGPGNENVEAWMANLWYDFPAPAFAPKLRPYVGIGGGLAALEIEDMAGAARLSERSEAYQAGAGLAYDWTRRTTFALDYRYFETDEDAFEPADLATRYRSDGVLASVRVALGSRRPTQLAVAPIPPQAREVEVAAFETVVLRPVNFQFDLAELTGPAQVTLDELAGRLAAHPEMTVVIEGHTDSIGSDAYNLDLGRRRAEAVREYLAGRGVDRDRLQVTSRGEAEPVASNRTPEGRAQNRRAEFQPDDRPRDVRIRIEGPTPASIDAADDANDPGR